MSLRSKTDRSLLDELAPANVQIDYAADDSCQIQLWCKGHVSIDVFRKACSLALERWDGRIVPLDDVTVSHGFWRTVRAPAEVSEYGVCDFVHVESAPGRGAYAVTVLKDWLDLQPEVRPSVNARESA